MGWMVAFGFGVVPSGQMLLAPIWKLGDPVPFPLEIDVLGGQLSQIVSDKFKTN